MTREKGLRPTSPVHVHVEDDVPVHVHVKQPKKKGKSSSVSITQTCLYMQYAATVKGCKNDKC